MKKNVSAYLSGVFATVLVLTMVTTALAASGKVSFNFVNVSLRGEQKIAAGADITVANGQKVPSSLPQCQVVNSKKDKHYQRK